MKEEEARELAFAIIGGDFEELLAEHDVFRLRDGILRLLQRETAAAGKR